MNIEKILSDNLFLIVPDGIKNKIVEQISLINKFYSYKIVGISELKKIVLFDYDIEDANRLGQGTEQIKDRSEYWIIMSLIYLLVEKDMKPYLEYGVESEDGYSSELPPISSQNKKNNKKNSLI